MTLLTAKKQFGVVLERTAGTTPQDQTSSLNDLDDVGAYDVAVIEATPSFDVEDIPRNFLRETISPVKGNRGRALASMSLTVEMASTAAGTFAAGAPGWGKLMQMAGFKQVSLHRLNTTNDAWAIDAGAADTPAKIGPMRHGEGITDGVLTATIVGDVHEGDRSIFLDAASVVGGAVGTWSTAAGATDTQDTFVEVTVSSVDSDVGWAWYPISDTVKAMETAANSVTIDRGSLIHGETSGARGVVFSDYDGAADVTLFFKPIRGTFGAAENIIVLSGATSAGATPIDSGVDTEATLGAVNERYDQWPPGSIALNEDGVRVDAVGARASVSFEFEVNRPIRIIFTPQGSWEHNDASREGIDDIPFVPGANPDIVDPPNWEGSAMGLQRNELAGDVPWDTSGNTDFEDLAAEILPCFTALSIDVAVNLKERKCASSTNGFSEVIGTGRAGSGSFTMEAQFEEDLGTIKRLRDGEIVRLRIPVGSISGDDYFEFRMPGVQYTGVGSGDDDGTLTREVNYSLTGGVLDNIDGNALGAVSSFGGDNELVLIHLVG